MIDVHEPTLKIPRLTDIQQLSIDSMRTFVQQEVTPHAALLRFGPASREQLLEFTQAVAEFGLPGLAVPKALGGSGMDWATQARLFEELVKGSPELASVVLINMLAVELLLLRPDLCSRYLPDLLAGRSIAGLGMAIAPHSTGRPLHAQRSGEHILLDGKIDEVAGGLWANLLISAVALDDQSSCFVLLDRRRDRYDTRAIRLDSNAARVQFTATRVSSEFVLGDAGAQSLLSRRLLEVLKLYEGVARVAQAQVMLDATLAAVPASATLEAPCVGAPLVTMHLAEMITQVEAARLMCHRGLLLAQEHQDCAAESSMALFFAQGAVDRIERHVDWINGTRSERSPLLALQLGALSCEESKVHAQSIVRHRIC